MGFYEGFNDEMEKVAKDSARDRSYGEAYGQGMAMGHGAHMGGWGGLAAGLGLTGAGAAKVLKNPEAASLGERVIHAIRTKGIEGAGPVANEVASKIGKLPGAGLARAGMIATVPAILAGRYLGALSTRAIAKEKNEKLRPATALTHTFLPNMVGSAITGKVLSGKIKDKK